MVWKMSPLRTQVVNVLADASVAPGKALGGSLEAAVPTLIGMQYDSMFISPTHGCKNNCYLVLLYFLI